MKLCLTVSIQLGSQTNTRLIWFISKKLTSEGVGLKKVFFSSCVGSCPSLALQGVDRGSIEWVQPSLRRQNKENFRQLCLDNGTSYHAVETFSQLAYWLEAQATRTLTGEGDRLKSLEAKGLSFVIV